MTDDASDWPEDYGQENGNYFQKCLHCENNFIGHKRRLVCRKCDEIRQAKWKAMSQNEQQAEVKLGAIHRLATSALQTSWLYSGKEHVEKLMREIAAISSGKATTTQP